MKSGAVPVAMPYVMPYTGPMRKTSVYLSDELAERLARIAREEDRSQAEVLRAAVAAYEPRPVVDRAFALDGCVTGPGGSVADVDEAELLRGFGS
jgi:predicted transcriptional regulator